jgi:hypothetical protein
MQTQWRDKAIGSSNIEWVSTGEVTDRGGAERNRDSVDRLAGITVHVHHQA